MLGVGYRQFRLAVLTSTQQKHQANDDYNRNDPGHGNHYPWSAKSE